MCYWPLLNGDVMMINYPTVFHSCPMPEIHEQLSKIFCHVGVLLYAAFEYIFVIMFILHSDNSLLMCPQVKSA
jgi:hypothetical protein